MKTCTFFGHRDCPESLLTDLRQVLRALICRYDVQVFLVGEQGTFDYLVLRALHELEREYPYIQVNTVLAYFPRGKKHGNYLLPEGMENVPPRFAIDRRNKWMIAKADYAVCYVQRNWGGAAKYMEIALRQKKTVINLFRTNLE